MSPGIATVRDEPALSRILVIDDDEVDRVTLRRFLGKAGISAVIDELPDGHDVIQRVSDNDYDCIVLDHLLPGETGFDVIARIRAASIRTPILCVSNQRDELGAALVAAGATEFLAKRDLSPGRLALRLRYALRLARAERARSAYEAQHQLLRAVMAQLGTGVAVVDPALAAVILVNPAGERLLGEGGAGLLAPASGLATEARAALVQALATESAVTLERAIAHGTHRYRVGAAPIVDRDGQLTAGVAVIDDVTADPAAHVDSDAIGLAIVRELSGAG